MSNMVERSSIVLKVRNLYKIKSFSSRYRKKKQFLDVLSYQKLHKFKFQDRKLIKMNILQEKEKVVTEYFEEDHNKEDEDTYCKDEEDLGSNSELSESESGDDEMEEEYVDSDEYDDMEEECNSDEDFDDLVEEEHSSEHEIENLSETNQLSQSKLSQVLVDYETTDNEKSLDEDAIDQEGTEEVENNGNIVLENMNEISNIDELNVSELDDDDVEALMAMQFRDTRLQSHIREHDLNLIPRDATRNDKPTNQPC